MRLIKIESNELYKIDYTEAVNEKLINIFANDMYAFVYVYKDGKLFSILRKNDIPLIEVKENLNEYYIYKSDKINPSRDEIEQKFTNEPTLSRLAVIHNGEVICEYNNGSEPTLGRNVTKSLMSIRYINVFKEQIYSEFRANSWSNVLVVANTDIFNVLSSELSEIKMTCINELSYDFNYPEYDLVIDLKYGKGLRKHFCGKANIVDLCKIIEKVALNELINYCDKAEINLHCLKLPTYKNLTCLSDKELSTWKNKKSFRDMILDEEFLREFSNSHRDYHYLRDGKHALSILFDDGFVNIQSNCNTDLLNVKNGVRKTIPEVKDADSKVHFFGTCSTFGVCCPDDETIQSFLQSGEYCSTNNIEVVNHGGMYGKHLLNTVMSALNQSVKEGDTIVVLDIFDEYTCSDVPNLVETYTWFNESKNKDEIYFLDYPTHCNAKGNRLYAEYIEKLLKDCNHNSGDDLGEFNYFTYNNLTYDKLKYMNLTNARMYMHLKKLKKMRVENRKNGMITIHASPFTLGHKYLVDEALKIVDFLYVFVVADDFGGINSIDRLEMIHLVLKDYNNVCVLPTETYFASNQFFPEYGKRSESIVVSNNVKLMEEINAKYVYNALNISVRILGEEKNDPVTAQYSKITSEMCSKYGVECVIIKRKSVDGNEVSAKKCRELLKEGDFLTLRKYMLPQLIYYINNMHVHKVYNLLLHTKPSEEELDLIKERLDILEADIKVINLYDSNSYDKKADNSEKNTFYVNIHYGLSGDYSKYSPMDFFFENIDDLTDDFLKLMIKFSMISEKRVLLYLGKFPVNSRDIDGGSQLAGQLIDSLKNYCKLDVVFIRKEHERFYDDKLNRIGYEEYINPYDNKFSRRLDNIRTNRSAILNYGNHDLIISGHCSKFFGLEYEKEIMEKAVIFPMFLTPSYKRAGEIVPEEYTILETEVLRNVDKIITPSEEEEKDIIEDYGVNKNKVKVIPRGISPYINGTEKKLNHKRIKLVTIGSIKMQKNHIENLKILKGLLERGIDAELIIIGAVHSPEYMQQLHDFIRINELNERVTFYSGITQKQVGEIVNTADISISSSRWETFGRGIFEGFSAGLPSVLSDVLDVIKKYAVGNPGVFFCKETEDMVQCICELVNDSQLYSCASKSVLQIAERFSYKTESEHLVRELLFKKFNISTPFFPWDLHECEKISESRYSICYRNGEFVRKYFKYDNKEKFLHEFRMMQKAYYSGVRVPKPLFFAYDPDNLGWYIQSEYCSLEEVSGKFSFIEYNSLQRELDKLNNIICDSDGTWDIQLKEFEKSLNIYGDYYNCSIDDELSFIRSLEQETIIHGDFLCKNIGMIEGEYNLFDFQNSCVGPRNWDINYYLSEFTADKIEDSIINSLKQHDINMIIAILKIRIGRAIRKKEDIELIEKRMKSWMLMNER